MKDKKGIVFGVANERSIAWGIAKELLKAGANVAFAYWGERSLKTLEKLTSVYPDSNCKFYECDVSKDEEVKATQASYAADYEHCDFLVHSVAFAGKSALEGKFFDVTKEDFFNSIDVSAFSLVTLTKAFHPLMGEGTSIIALTYLGAVKTITNYNTMGVAKATLESCVRYLATDLGPEGIRVNAISAGPVNTLAARGISGFTKMLKVHRKIAPLRANTTADQVGKAGYFLLSPASYGMSAEIMYVDGGFHEVAMGPMDAYNMD